MPRRPGLPPSRVSSGLGVACPLRPAPPVQRSARHRSDQGLRPFVPYPALHSLLRRAWRLPRYSRTAPATLSLYPLAPPVGSSTPPHPISWRGDPSGTRGSILLLFVRTGCHQPVCSSSRMAIWLWIGLFCRITLRSLNLSPPPVCSRCLSL